MTQADIRRAMEELGGTATTSQIAKALNHNSTAAISRALIAMKNKYEVTRKPHKLNDDLRHACFMWSLVK